MLDHTSHRDVLWIVLALLCLYRQLPGTCANNPLQLDPPSIVVRYGDPASANCSTNVAHAGMGWEASQGGVEMKMVQFMTWAVQNVTHWDLKPLCFVNTNESGQKQAKLNITIYKPPDRVSLTIVNHTGPMIAGRHYELQCDVQNVAPVHLLAVNFYKGQDLLDTKYKSNDTKVQVNTSLSLHVSPGRDEYVADYKCEAELDLGPQTPPPTVASDLLTVEVQFPPSKIVELENASVSRGEDVVLKCSSKGNPQIRYRWIYHETSNVRVSDEDGVSLLRINNTSEDNIGTYMCIAYNDLDATNHTVRVDIHGAKATCPLSISPAEKLLEYGTIINLTCDSSVNTTRQSWEYLNQVHNESVLVINSNAVYNRLDWNVRASCHGEFVGLDSCTEHYSVTVYKRPDNVSISAVDHTGPMIQNQNYTLRCDVRNVAPIQFLRVNWYEGKDLVSSKTFKNATKNPDDVSTTLKISPRRHITQYKCEAKLDFGSDLSQVMSFSHDIVVHEKPSIKKLPERVPLFRGYPVHLACEASGFPEPVITWSSGNKTVKRGNLTIDNAGKYTCTASNPAGTDVKTVTAEMKEDYLPLIAGIVALVVVIISVVFIIIYSIYYKNTKMGHYTVKGAKPNDQNGNIAQNGKGTTIPMKKIFV